MPTKKKRYRFHDGSGDEETNENLENFEDEYRLKEFYTKKILKSLKSEPPADWEFLGRINEFKEISEYIRNCILCSVSGVIYISGSPGTGKTYTINRILNILENNSPKKLGFAKPANYKIVRTNASKFASYFYKNSASPNGIALFVHLLELMKFQTRIIEEFKRIYRNEGFQECVIYFMKQLSNKRAKFIVFIDEIDLAPSNRNNGDAVFELFKAVINFPDSGLLLLAASNTVQIGNEIVKKIGANLKNKGRIKLMVFSPYSHNALRDIVLQRIDQASNLKNDSILDKAGIELCVRKIASVYGDCRRTLDACYLTLGKFIFERQSQIQIQKEKVISDESEDSDSIQVEDLSNASTRENSPKLNTSPLNPQEAVSPYRLRTRSMPANMSVPIGSFQNVIGRIHQTSQGRLKMIKTLPLHQQYVMMGIILAIVGEQNQAKKGYNSLETEKDEFSASEITNTRVSVCHSKRKYQQICAEFITPPEEYKDMLDALESNNMISISNGTRITKKSSSFHRGAMRVNCNKESMIELMFPVENVINALISLPKLGPIFTNLLPHS